MKNLILLFIVVVVGTACDSLLLSCKGGVAPSEFRLEISDSDSVYIDSFLVTGMDLRSEINMMYLHYAHRQKYTPLLSQQKRIPLDQPFGG